MQLSIREHAILKAILKSVQIQIDYPSSSEELNEILNDINGLLFNDKVNRLDLNRALINMEAKLDHDSCRKNWSDRSQQLPILPN